MKRTELEKKFKEMIYEDSHNNDVSSKIIPKTKRARAKIISKDVGVLSGIKELNFLFKLYKIKIIKSPKKDGSKIRKKDLIFELTGNARTLLLIERTALNLLSRMSGISTNARAFISKARKKNKKLKIAATRKTAPLLSYFDKCAVVVAGGDSHRKGLYDMVMLKENHLFSFSGGITKAIEESRKKTKGRYKIEVETTSEAEALEAARAGADVVMLDNFTSQQIKKTITLLEREGLRKKIKLEASGGINLKNISSYAKTGVDVISVGALTHSVTGLDFTMKFI